MKALTKLTVATLAVAAIGAVAVHTIEAHVISPVSALHRDGASDSKTYADWQGPLGQSFGARFLAQGAPRDAIAGGVPRPWSHPAHLPGLGEHAGGTHVVCRRRLVNAGVLSGQDRRVPSADEQAGP